MMEKKKINENLSVDSYWWIFLSYRSKNPFNFQKIFAIDFNIQTFYFNIDAFIIYFQFEYLI